MLFLTKVDAIEVVILLRGSWIEGSGARRSCHYKGSLETVTEDFSRGCQE